MKVYIQGAGEVNLPKDSFVSSGGQAEVYALGTTCYKIYHESDKMIPVGKIKELSKLTDINVIKPEKVLLDNKTKPIGFTMRYLPKTTALCQLFTRSFRERNGLDSRRMFDLVQGMRAGVEHVHSAGILIVDLNEMNFLTDQKFSEVYFIDVDSYQTPSFPADALMESIRDRHMKHYRDFSEGTDWFSFGIISFQMLVGIHPYKGRHKSLKSLDDRMLANVSVLNSSVTVPQACYSFDVIPANWRKWYKAIFDEGKRVPPPVGLAEVVFIPVAMKNVGPSVGLSVQHFLDSKNRILDFWNHAGQSAVLTQKEILVKNGQIKTFSISNASDVLGVFWTSKNLKPILATSSGFVDLLSSSNLPFGLKIDDLMIHENRVYIRTESQISQLQIHEADDKLILSTKQVSSVLPKASKFHDGCIVQDLLGTTYVTAFPKDGVTRQFAIKELQGHRVISAKYSNQILMVLTNYKGRYDRWMLKLAENHASYEISVEEDVGADADLNFVVVLTNGICVWLKDEKIQAFSNKVRVNQIKEVEDNLLKENIRLVTIDGMVGAIRDNEILSIKMK